MKKFLLAATFAIILTGSILYVPAQAEIPGEVYLNQAFSIKVGEEKKLKGYPISIYLDGTSVVNCFAAPCPSPMVYLRFLYPFGSYSAEFSEGVLQSYRGASMVVTNITSDSATVYATTSMVMPHPVGTNIRTTDGTIYIITSDYERRPYTSAGAFLSYGFNNFNSVVDANTTDMMIPQGNFAPPADGKVFCSDRGDDKGTCYLIESDFKSGFVSESVFTELGFNFSNAYYGDVSWLYTYGTINTSNDYHRPGVLINNNGTIYLVGRSSEIKPVLIGIPSMDVFNSWGLSLKDVVAANKDDATLITVTYLPMREPGQIKYDFFY